MTPENYKFPPLLYKIPPEAALILKASGGFAADYGLRERIQYSGF